MVCGGASDETYIVRSEVSASRGINNQQRYSACEKLPSFVLEQCVTQLRHIARYRSTRNTDIGK